jgi:hypothetical protein
MAINRATAEAMMDRSRFMRDDFGGGFEGLARLADALEDEKANLEVEIPMVGGWLVHAGICYMEYVRPNHVLLTLSMNLVTKRRWLAG